MLLGCASRNATDAATAAERYAKLKRFVGPAMANCETLGDVVTLALSDLQSVATIDRIELYLPSGADFSNYRDEWATVHWAGAAYDQPSIFVASADLKKGMQHPRRVGASFMLDVVVMNGGFLREIAQAVSATTEAGWK